METDRVCSYEPQWLRKLNECFKMYLSSGKYKVQAWLAKHHKLSQLILTCAANCQ